METRKLINREASPAAESRRRLRRPGMGEREDEAGVGAALRDAEPGLGLSGLFEPRAREKALEAYDLTSDPSREIARDLDPRETMGPPPAPEPCPARRAGGRRKDPESRRAARCPRPPLPAPPRKPRQKS